MTETLEDGSDWSALHRFRALASDTERFEQMFMTSLAASRTSKQNGTDIANVQATVLKQNSRIGKLETRWIQGAAVIAFLMVVVPMIIAGASLIK